MNDIRTPRQQKPVSPAPAAPPKLQPQPEPKPLSLPTKKRSLKWLWITLAAVVLLVAAVVGFGYMWYQDSLQPKATAGDRVKVVVEPGTSAEAVAQNLEQKGLIRSSLALTIYMKLTGNGNIKAGTYLLSPGQTPQEMVQWLGEGRVDTFKVTVLPGKTIAQIRESLVADGYEAAAVDAALAKTYDHPLLADKPANASLEGYIYPETYFVTSDTSVEDLLKITFDEFEKQLLQNNLRQAVAAAGFSLHQGVILASIIEREVSGSSDQRQVAQVFLKRLKEGMPLGADATYHYGAKLLGVEPSPQLDSPYNTRLHLGLTPGPIANFRLSALQAVANPADGSYLFFVSGDDGTTHFSHTFAEHEDNIRKYCHKLCSMN